MGASFNDFPHVFSPVKVGPVELKNRLQFSPLVSAHATTIEGYVTDSLVEFLGAQARSGAGMVTIGSSPVDFDRARDFIGCLSVTRDEDIAGLKRLSTEVHRYGAKISAELIHAGRVARQDSLGGRGAFVPSICPDLDPAKKFVEITVEQMEEVKQHFVQAALRLQQADYDFLMIHGAHGNLLSAFLSPRTNLRTDEYGGSLENRMRFPLEVVKAVREAIGPSMGIEYRISSYEYLENSPTIDDVATFLMAAEPYVDLFNLSGGLICDKSIVRYMMPGYPIARSVNVERTAYVRNKLTKACVAAVGNIPDMAAAEEILAEGKADIVAMARNIVADMDYVNKAYRNETDQIRPCLHCNICCTTPGRGGQVRCSVNPTVGRETKYRRIERAETPKKVMIIGGGPAGMQAAQTACKRGHDVTLYEQASELGGRLHEASSMYCKDYFRRYLDWDIRMTQASGAKIVLDTFVTPDLIAAEKPDALVIAVGAQHIVPPIPGIDGPNVMDVSAADLHQAPIGERVVFCGGGTSATESAIDLAHAGKQVTLIDMQPQDLLLRELANEIRAALVAMIDEFGITFIGEAKICSIGEGYVEYEKDGKIERIETDTVVTSCGLRPDKDAIEPLKYLLPETYVVGDAREARNIFWANMDAFDVAVEI